VRGVIDAHSHPFSNEGFGGGLFCGATFSTAGIADALKDCPTHYPDGRGALLENVTKGADPFAPHDPVGYPTFADWPAHNSLTHQQMYDQWVERAWRGGQRVLVADLVSNSAFCMLFSQKYACDDMSNVRRQAQTAYDPQAYVDQLAGGTGQPRGRPCRDRQLDAMVALRQLRARQGQRRVGDDSVGKRVERQPVVARQSRRRAAGGPCRHRLGNGIRKGLSHRDVARRIAVEHSGFRDRRAGRHPCLGLCAAIGALRPRSHDGARHGIRPFDV